MGALSLSPCDRRCPTARYQFSRRKEFPKPSPNSSSETLQTRPFTPNPETQESDQPRLKSNIPSPQLPITAPQGQRPQPIQPKLTIGAAGDKYEQEADRVASQVVQHIHSPSPNADHSVQREAMPEEDELGTSKNTDFSGSGNVISRVLAF